MPLYEYQCTACGRIEEAIQKFSDAPLATCKHCSGQLNKMISQSSFHLKGTGWYVTDYSKKATSTDGKKSAEASTSSSEKTASGSTDTKVAASDN